MKKVNRFTLEQQIMECWHVVDDIDVMHEFIGDDKFFEGMKPEHQDKIMNLLLGMKEMYGLKFDRTFKTFEQCVHNSDVK